MIPAKQSFTGQAKKVGITTTAGQKLYPNVVVLLM
jgi:hypothetical protein